MHRMHSPEPPKLRRFSGFSEKGFAVRLHGLQSYDKVAKEPTAALVSGPPAAGDNAGRHSLSEHRPSDGQKRLDGQTREQVSRVAASIVTAFARQKAMLRCFGPWRRNARGLRNLILSFCIRGTLRARFRGWAAAAARRRRLRVRSAAYDQLRICRSALRVRLDRREDGDHGQVAGTESQESATEAIQQVACCRRHLSLATWEWVEAVRLASGCTAPASTCYWGPASKADVVLVDRQTVQQGDYAG
jgi:hypothetical protein